MQRFSAKKGQVGLEDTTAELLRRCSGAFDRTDEVLHEIVEVLGAAVGQVVFGQMPDALIRIQLRRVGRETLQAQTRMLAQQLIQRFALMGGGVIHKHHDRAAQVSKQMAEEEAHFLLPDVAEPTLVEEAEMLSLMTVGGSRDPGDSRTPL